MNSYTNTLPDGTSASDLDCLGWTAIDNKNTTTVGDSAAADTTWSNLAPNQFCSNLLRLYCFQDL